MTSRTRLPEQISLRIGCTVALAVGTVCLSTGCEEDAPPPVVVVPAPPPPPPPPPEPTVKSIAELMKELNIDPKVELPEERAPETTEERVAVLLFWNAFAKGDAPYASSQMGTADKRVLDGIQKSGHWANATTKIERIEVQCANDGEGFSTLGVLTLGASDEQPLLWDVTLNEANAATFTAFAGPPDILDHLSGENWIEAWKKYVNGLFEKYANLPDEEVEIPQENVQLAESDDAAPTPPADEGGGGGAGGGGAPMRKRPTGPPERGPVGPSPGR